MLKKLNSSKLKRLITALENAGEKDMPPVRALAVAVVAAITLIENDNEKSDNAEK